MPDYKHLLVERRGPVAIVTMNRPEKANALNYDHLAEIEDAALSFREDGDTRAVVFAGAGKHFSSGADLTDPGRATAVYIVFMAAKLLPIAMMMATNSPSPWTASPEAICSA